MFVQTHADVLGLPVVLPDTTESVLLGSAILAATAFKATTTASMTANTETSKECDVSLDSSSVDVSEMMMSMGGSGKEILPRPEVAAFHSSKYKVFLKLLECQMECVTIMAEGCRGFFC